MTQNFRRYDTRHGSVALRPERPDDDAFLFALFVSHAARSLRQGGLPEAAIAPLMTIQYKSQSGTHRAQFPDAVYFVDFAFLPERQAKGLGTALIEMIADEWGLRGHAARVEVMLNNEPSLKLCRNLGFVRSPEAKMGYYNLRREPPSRPEG